MAKWFPTDVKNIMRIRSNDIVNMAGEYPAGCLTVDPACKSGVIPHRIMVEHGHKVDMFDINGSFIFDECKTYFKAMDAHNVNYEKYELIICAGLLYHLKYREQVSLIRRWRGKSIILDTHVAISCKENGMLRDPTWSTKRGLAFVPTYDMLVDTMLKGWNLKEALQSRADRWTFHFVPVDNAA